MFTPERKSNTSFSRITAGLEFTCGLAAGRAYCWVSLKNKNQLPSGLRMLIPTFAPACPSCLFSLGCSDQGRNNYGQLGLGSLAASETPKAVIGGHIFKSLDAGHYHVCGLKTDGTVVCWG
jgi:hypothetical protein